MPQPIRILYDIDSSSHQGGNNDQNNSAEIRLLEANELAISQLVRASSECSVATAYAA